MNTRRMCFPEIAEAKSIGTRFEGEGLGHPLIFRGAMRAEFGAVERGDARAAGERVEHVWKSTLLRTVGINAVLAMAGAPVCVRRRCE